ncbi:MAG: sarcosine oxidase subunit gamma SoxG [Gemmatimonadota bacterium]|nr:sarcosine oxidase subunit gamma SoxG [Gemmatimonadota bacterium]
MKIGPPFRRSPVSFDATPAETELRDGWTVVLRYEDEDDRPGPRLVDLSHRRRWDFQDADVAARRPMDLPVPGEYGQVGVHAPLVINRMNRTQVAIWHLGESSSPPTPPTAGFTETTDGHCMLAFVGPGVPQVLEHLTPLDLFDPVRPTPFLTQGPVLRVPCQIVTFAAHLVVMTLARGYGRTFADAALKSGGPVGLTPGGERRFVEAIAAL